MNAWIAITLSLMLFFLLCLLVTLSPRHSSFPAFPPLSIPPLINRSQMFSRIFSRMVIRDTQAKSCTNSSFNGHKQVGRHADRLEPEMCAQQRPAKPLVGRNARTANASRTAWSTTLDGLGTWPQHAQARHPTTTITMTTTSSISFLRHQTQAWSRPRRKPSR